MKRKMLKLIYLDQREVTSDIQNSRKDFCSHESLMLPRKRKRGKEEVANASSKKYSIY